MYRVAVVTPTVRVDEYLYQAIHSVQENLFGELLIHHYVVLDDPGSSFDFGRVLPASGYQISLLINQGERGASAARNCGLVEIYRSTTKFDLIGFLDADDRLGPNYFQVLIECYVRLNAPLYYGQGRVDDEQNLRRGFSNTPLPAGKVSYSELRWNCVGCPSGVFFDPRWPVRPVFFPPNLPFLEDWLFYLSVVPKGQAIVKIEAVYFYRLHASQSTKNFGAAVKRSLRRNVYSAFRGPINFWRPPFSEFLRVELSLSMLFSESLTKRLVIIALLGLTNPRWLLYKGLAAIWR